MASVVSSSTCNRPNSPHVQVLFGTEANLQFTVENLQLFLLLFSPVKSPSSKLFQLFEQGIILLVTTELLATGKGWDRSIGKSKGSSSGRLPYSFKSPLQLPTLSAYCPHMWTILQDTLTFLQLLLGIANHSKLTEAFHCFLSSSRALNNGLRLERFNLSDVTVKLWTRELVYLIMCIYCKDHQWSLLAVTTPHNTHSFFLLPLLNWNQNNPVNRLTSLPAPTQPHIQNF